MNFLACDLGGTKALLGIYERVINDFAVQIYGIPFLKKNQYSTIQNGSQSEGTNNDLHAIVGAGTGLGIARCLISGNKVKVLASEGGHVEYSPKSELEWDLKTWLKNSLNIERISCERIISGTGLSRIAEWRLSKPDAQNHPLQKYLKKIKNFDAARKELPEKICNLSEEGDKLMIEVESIWLGAYASLLGDVALQELCFGGLWISGGTASKHFKNFKSDLFMKQFFDKGRFKDILKTIPMKVILDEEFGLFSAACRAKMLLKT